MKNRDWPALARALGAVLPRNCMHPGVLGWIEKNGASSPWSLACSGGADSLSLVLLLHAHFPEFREKMHILHFNHLLRGIASDQDEEFARQLAEGLGLKLRCGRWDNPGAEKPSGAASARQARFRFFSDSMDEIESQILFLGHQMEDIAESLLMRVGRGSGLGGLAAPRPVHTFRAGKVHLRPLLELKKTDILEALSAQGIPWREDASNQGEKYTRNRLRWHVLPAWQQATPQDIFKGSARTRALAEEDEEALEQWLDSLLPPEINTTELDLRPLFGKPLALWRRAFHRFLIANELEKSFSASEVDRWVADLARNRPKKSSAGKSGFIEFRSGRLLFLKKTKVEPNYNWPTLRIPVGAILYWPDSTALKTETKPISLHQRTSILSGKIDQRCAAYLETGSEKSSFLLVRGWKPGDRYHPLGAPGSRKLQDMFTDRKVSALERKRLPVVCNHEGEILWVPGLLPADALKITENTSRAIRLTYIPAPSA